MLSNSLASAPTRSFDRMNQFMEEMFGNKFDFTPWPTFAPWNPPVDIQETEKEYTFVAELPGFNQKQINVELSNDILTISGFREDTTEQKEWNYIRRERYYGEFKRSFKLDTHVRPDGIKANFKDGILYISVPKIEAVKPHKIQVHA